MIFIPGSLPLSQHLLTDPGHAVREIADDGVHSAADHSTDVLLLIHGPGINLNTMALDLSHHLFRHVAKGAGIQRRSSSYNVRRPEARFLSEARISDPDRVPSSGGC